MHRHLTSFCIVFLLSVLLLTGCRTDLPDEESAAETTAAAASDGIILAADGRCLFSVLRPEDATEGEIATTVDLRKTAESLFGIVPDADTDWAIPKGMHTPAGFEILIGRTEAEESKAVYAALPYDGYTVRVVGNKLVVAGWRDETQHLLRDMLAQLLKTHTENGICTIPADYEDTRTLGDSLSHVPHYGGYVDSVVDLDDGSYMLYLENAKMSDMDAYCATLRDAGYALYTEHTAADNRFATYVGEQGSIHVYYTEAYRTLRIVIDPPNTPLPARAADVPACEKITEPSVSMIGLNYTGTENTAHGLCMVFLLPNGEFILVDGGFTIPDDYNYLYNHLRSLAPDPDNIVIAAWYLTHAHTDHTPAFNGIVDHHYDHITIRQLVYNFTFSSTYDIVQQSGTTEVSVRNIAKKMNKTEIIKAHTGQVFHYPGGSVEMLFTYDDYLPREIPEVNATSLIFRVTIGGQTVMIMGDASSQIVPMACRMYGTYLKSDIVQMAHHGGSGATEELYTLIHPHTALWPAGEAKYQQHLNRACNQTLLGIVQDLYLARFDVITLPMPYTPVGNNPYHTPS